MSKPVSAALQIGLDAHITEPSYLIEMLLDVPVYLTTMDEVTWNAHSWVAAAARVEQLTARGGRVVLRNDDNSGSSLVLNNVLRDKEVIIYAHYNGDASEILRGYVSDAVIGAMDVTVDIEVNRVDRAIAPRMRIVAPVFTRILAPGTVIYQANQTLRVK